MRNRPFLVAACLIIAGVVAGVAGVSVMQSNVVNTLIAQSKNVELGAKQPPVKVDPDARALNNAFKAVSKAVDQTVVSISVVTERKQSSRNRGGGGQGQDFFFRFFGQPFGGGEGEDEMPQNSQGSGSGVFITPNGFIITNNHVVEDAKADGIKVTTADKKEYKARLIGRDPLTDLAVIKIEGSGFSPAYFGNSDETQVGEWVVAVGNPLGLNHTITAGIVSAIGRGGLDLNRDRNGYGVENFIQTDAAINPGNSGGGLFDLEGRLVGINSAIATRTGYYQGYGFAIPANLAKSVAADLIEDGKINRGYLGVQITSLDQATAKALGLNDVSGVLIQSVQPKSGAEDAGLQEGDVILQIDGKNVSSSNELQSVVSQRRAGDNVNLVLWRDAKKINKSVRLKQREESQELASNDERPTSGNDRKEDEDNSKPTKFDNLGFTVETLTDDLKKALEVKEGVVVSKVEPYSEVSRAIGRGDVITMADRKPVRTMKQLKDIIAAKKPGDALLLQVRSRNGSRIVGIEIPKG